MLARLPRTHQRRFPLVALLSADGISMLGNELTLLAIPWFVLETTGSPTRTGITAAVSILPVILAGVVGGAVVDRLGAKPTSVIADLASGITVALIPLLHHTVGLAFWQLLVLVFLSGLLDAPGRAARRSLLPDLAQRGAVSLERTNAFAQIAMRAAGLTGPILAGVLIVVVGTSNVLWIDAGTFAVSALMVAIGVPARSTAMPPHVDHQLDDEPLDAEPTSEPLELLAGLRFIGQDPVIRWLTILAVIGGLLAEPVYAVILPVYAQEVFGSATGLGVAYAALGAGSLLGNALFLALGPRLPRRPTIVVGYTVRALGFWVLVPLPSVAVVASSIAVSATMLEPTNPITMTIYQERIPPHLRGRVFGAMMAIDAVAAPVGIVVYGLLLEHLGLRNGLLIFAAVNLLVPLVAWLAPSLHDMQRERPQPS